jgi:hypothetical protein
VKKKDVATAYQENRVAEIEVQKERLQFDIACRNDEVEVKKRKIEVEEKRFEREEYWRQEEVRGKERDRKASFVLQMAKEGKTPEEIRAMWALMNEV